jgi:HTH-type transcriptional regulator/antitoxin HigA
MTLFAEEIRDRWAAIAPLLSVRTAGEYDEAIGRLNSLLDEVGTDEGHPLYGLPVRQMRTLAERVDVSPAVFF